MKISVVGLGKVGSPLAAVLASKGFSVVGTDLNSEYTDALSAGTAPVDEPGLSQLIAANPTRLRATPDCHDAVRDSDVTFIVVPTPSDDSGGFTNDFVLNALETVGVALRRKTAYHLVVLTSTVMPGSTGGELREALERASLKKVGNDLGLCYNPEFIALGSVVRDLLYPDLILIGESDSKAGEILAGILTRRCDNQPLIRRMNFVNAEVTKLAINTFLTTKISYANMLGDVCEHLEGADVNVVTEAVGSDSRIGRKYLSAAIGYGGPCFPRDNVAFAALAGRLGARNDLASATHAINDYQLDRLLRIVRSHHGQGAPIAVLGLSYKANTPVVEGSQGVALVRRLLELQYQVIAYDPKADMPAQSAVLPRFERASSAVDAVRAASLVVVMTPWDEFRCIPIDAFARKSERLCVVDCWRVIPPDFAAVADLVYLGVGASRVQSAHGVASRP